MNFEHRMIVLFLFFYGILHAQDNLAPLDKAVLISRNLITETGYCSDGSDRSRGGKPRFAGPMEARIISFNNYQYLAYYESNGDIIIARRKIGSDLGWKKSILQGYKITSNDRHNKIALAISKGDGVIHLSFDHHNTPVLNYAHTQIGTATHPENVVWNNQVFALLPNLGLKEDTGLVTYPSFSNIDTTGDLIIYWRTGGSIGGEMNLANYNSANNNWTFIGQISSRDGHYRGRKGTRGPYHAGFVPDGNGALHVAWLWREDFKQRDVLDNIGNHGLYYAQSNDGGFTWKNSDSKTVASTASGLKMGIDNMGDVPVEISMKKNPTNVGLNSAIDSKTQDFYVMVTHYRKGMLENANFLYKRTPQGLWSVKETTITGKCKIIFCGDYLYCFYDNTVQYASRKKAFNDWKEITLPVKLKKGRANWETNNLEKGEVSMVIQYDPKKLGEPTPIEVFDFKITASKKEK